MKKYASSVQSGTGNREQTRSQVSVAKRSLFDEFGLAWSLTRDSSGSGG
jgi:hypothetical protein